MTAIPARVAGVREIIAVCPRPEPTVLAAAREAGVTRLFRIGGAHAIAALAYGTATIPRVDKIVGPGNALRRGGEGARRRANARSTSTPGRARSSSSSATGRPAWIAADLIAQAEHDPDARAISHHAASRRARRARRAAVAAAVPADGPARAGACRQRRRSSWHANAGRGDRARRTHGAGASRRATRDALPARLTRAGTIFVGDYSAQAAGDYATGSNHVLPTAAPRASAAG